MAEDMVTKYADAKNRYKKAMQRLKEIGHFLYEVGDAMQRNPGSVGFSNTGVGVQMGAITNTYNGDNWLTAKQIMELNAEMHKAKHEAENCWHALPQNLRDTVLPLDKL